MDNIHYGNKDIIDCSRESYTPYWSKKDDTFLRKKYDDLSDVAIAKELNKEPSEVKGRRLELDLLRDDELPSEEWIEQFDHFHIKNNTEFIKGLCRDKFVKKKNSFEDYLNDVENTTISGLSDDVFGDERFDETRIKKSSFTKHLLNNDITKREWDYLRRSLKRRAYQTDSRHTEEYAFDIVLGWLTEDFIVKKLRDQSNYAIPQSEDWEIRLYGDDANREFKELSNTAKPDIRIRDTNDISNNFNLDLFVDYNGIWRERGYIDLKKGKINHFADFKLSFVIAFDVKLGGFYLINRQDVDEYELTYNPSMRRKTANIPLNNPIDISELLSKIYRVEKGGNYTRVSEKKTMKSDKPSILQIVEEHSNL